MATTLRRCTPLVLALLWGCASHRPAPVVSKPAPSKPDVVMPPYSLPPAKPHQIPRQGSGYYKDDGPLLDVPYDLDAIPEPTPRLEPLHRFANRPYNVLGQAYTPRTAIAPFRQRGIASWYGRKFHGQRTSIGETYDMFQLTAAHPTLAVPSYARVTNVENGKSVVVRINDRGPFHKERVIDLSYAAAYRLGYQDRGSANVDVVAIVPGDDDDSSGVALVREAERTPQATTPLAGESVDPLAAFAAEAVTASSLSAAENPIAEANGDGLWLQLGAFGSAGGAEAFRAKIGDELGWLGPLAVESNGKVWRVRAGPFASRPLANQTAQRLTREADLRPVVTR